MSDEAKPAATSEERPPPSSEIDDADDLRGFHFKRLLRLPLTLIIAAVLVVGAAIAGMIFAGPAIAAAAAAGALLLVVIGVFFIADSQSEGAFFEAFASQRDLKRTPSGDLHRYTPLLCKGDKRQATQIMHGKHAKGVGGTLALYTYTDVYHDKNGRHENNYNFTVAITKLPQVAPLCSELLCNRKFGFKAFEKLEDAFRSEERVRLESVDLDERFEIFADEKQDANWLRQLFSPSFIVWLCEHTPEDFAFELVDGVLVCNVHGHKKSAAELDELREAITGITRRLREEADETVAPAGEQAPAT